MTTTASLRAHFKAVERGIAEYLGGERVPVNGRTRGSAPDIQHPWLAIEVKTRTRLPVLLASAMDQARKSAEWARRREAMDKLPIAVIHQRGQHFKNALVVMSLGDFQDYFGNTKLDLP